MQIRQSVDTHFHIAYVDIKEWNCWGGWYVDV